MSSVRFAIAGLVLFLAAGGGGGDIGTSPGGGGGGGPLVHATRVTATSGLAFNPSAVTIPAGDTIYFTFQSVQHNVVFDTQGAPGDIGTTSNTTVKLRFPTAGTYNYHCSLHNGMTGSVTVQ